MFRSSPIRVMYGPPLDLTNLNRDEIVEAIDQTLTTMFADLRAGRISENGMAEPRRTNAD